MLTCYASKANSDTCKHEFDDRGELIRHLVGTHGWSEEDAQAYADDRKEGK